MRFSYSGKNILAVFFDPKFLLIAIAGCLVLSYPQVCVAGSGSGISFEAPAFATPASGGELDVMGFPSNETSICAYARYSPIDIEQAKGRFRTIEDQGDTYVMGTMQVYRASANFGDASYPHFYVNRDGWVIAFIPRSEPDGYAISTYIKFGTSLELAIEYFCAEMNIPFVRDGLKYYDFQYPNAMGMVLASTTGTGTFFINIPASIDVLSLGWVSSKEAQFHKIDGVKLTDAPYLQEFNSRYGEIQLTKGVKHEISAIYVFGLVVIYR
jgi:hypothetical protein